MFNGREIGASAKDHIIPRSIAPELDSALFNSVEGGTQSVDSWFRSVLLQRLALDFGSIDGQKCEEAAKQFASDFEWLLKVMPTWKSASKLKGLTPELWALQMMFQATIDPSSVKASEASRAKGLLTSPLFSVMEPVFTSNVAGMEYMTGLTDLMQRGANDEIADKRFGLAEQAFNDPNMFGIALLGRGVVTSEISIENSAGIVSADIMVFSLLSDALHQVVEANGMWSVVRAEERSQDVQNVVEKVSQTLGCIDIVLAWFAAGLLKEGMTALQKTRGDFDESYDSTEEVVLVL